MLQVSVNEAAAQICLHVPALLTRRDELFPLARQVVRNSGYQYSKGHSRSELNGHALLFMAEKNKNTAWKNVPRSLLQRCCFCC